MKTLKKVLVAASLASLLIGNPINAATKEDINSLIKETQKTEILNISHQGVIRKSLVDMKRVGDNEKNIFFGINYWNFEDNQMIQDVLVILDYVKYDGNKLDIKHLAIKDGYGNPDGKPDAIEESRVFEIEHIFDYEDENGIKKRVKMREVESFSSNVTYSKEWDEKEKERIGKIYDKGIEIFKLKIKKTLTDGEKTQYQDLRSEIEELVLDSKLLQKSKQELMYPNKL